MKKLVASLAVASILALSALSVNVHNFQFSASEKDQAISQPLQQEVLMAGGGDEWSGG